MAPSAATARPSAPGRPASFAAACLRWDRSASARATACLCFWRWPRAALTDARWRIWSSTGSRKAASSRATCSVANKDSWSAQDPSFVSASLRGACSVWPRSVNARPNSNNPFATSLLRFASVCACLDTFWVWASRFATCASSDSKISSSDVWGTFAVCDACIEALNEATLPSSQAPTRVASVPSPGTCVCRLGALSFSWTFASALAFSKPASSACKKVWK